VAAAVAPAPVAFVRPAETPVAVAPANANAVAPAAPTPVEAWRRARAELERSRPRVAALLANASVLEIEATKLVLGFADRSDVEAAERLRSTIEPILNAEFGGQVHLVAKIGGSAAPTVVRAETVDEADAQLREKQTREQEARRHPLIQKAQDLFGASIREIKTL
jgi:hypothetical protein